MGNAGCQTHPQPCVQNEKARKQVTTSTPVHPAFPHANGFNGLYALFPVNRAFLPPSPARIAQASSPACCQRRGIRTTRLRRMRTASRPALDKRLPPSASIASLGPTCRDDRDTSLFIGPGRRESLKMICPSAKAKYFCREGWTGFWKRQVICPSGKWRQASQANLPRGSSLSSATSAAKSEI